MKVNDLAMNKQFFIVVLVLAALPFLHACRERSAPVVLDKDTYLQRGDSLTRISFDSLRNTLLKKISAEGFAGAVRFCKVEASNLTGAFNGGAWEISRTSLQYRNPGNLPDSLSKHALLVMQSSLDKGETPQAQIVEDELGIIHYYKPIMVQAMCLNCHGTMPGQVSPEVAAVIDSLYPGDLARNYKEGDLRGAWHIRFTREPGR